MACPRPQAGPRLHAVLEGIPARREARHVSETLEILGAADLQAVIVRRPAGRRILRRSACPPRTTVILNTVHPETGLVHASGPVYYDLQRWHLTLEDDPEARAALQRGKVATTLESLRRQGRQRYTLPERIERAVEDRDRPLEPNTHIRSTTLRMFMRCGPSGWWAAVERDRGISQQWGSLRDLQGA